jgi:hypothetical protein
MTKLLPITKCTQCTEAVYLHNTDFLYCKETNRFVSWKDWAMLCCLIIIVEAVITGLIIYFLEIRRY